MKSKQEELREIHTHSSTAEAMKIQDQPERHLTGRGGGGSRLQCWRLNARLARLYGSPTPTSCLDKPHVSPGGRYCA